MREQGWTNEDVIQFEDAAFWVAYVFGKDSRTIKRHMVDLVKYSFLIPHGKQLPATPKIVTKQYPSGKLVPITYRGDTKGLYRAYRFGPKLRVVEYQETLNPKYVPPPPPFNNVVKDSLPETQKNMCDLRKAAEHNMDERSERLLALLEDLIDNKNNNNSNNVSRSHILLDIENTKQKKNESSAERNEKNGGNSISNTISNNSSISNKQAKKLDIDRCPVCSKPGSLQSRYTLNSRKKRYGPYYYFEHYEDGKVQWCYIGRNPASKKNKREDTLVAEENKR